MTMLRTLNHTIVLFICVVLLAPVALAESDNLLEGDGARWHQPNEGGWEFTGGELSGSSKIFDGEKTDPDASVFLVGKDTFSGDFSVQIDVTFVKGRYLGVYLDYSQETQSGIWMATGHLLDDSAADNEIERAYIKTVDDGTWIVRATGDLAITPGKRISLGFARQGDVYSLWNEGRLIATYYKEGGYPAGPLQLRLTNARAQIHRMDVQSGLSK